MNLIIFDLLFVCVGLVMFWLLYWGSGSSIILMQFSKFTYTIYNITIINLELIILHDKIEWILILGLITNYNSLI